MISRRFLDLETGNGFTFAALGLTAAIGVCSVLRSVYLTTEPSSVIESPLSNIKATLSKREQEKLPYPPDALPGARDVSTPYGSIRVYEWGPEDGRKVLLVHGISTPCIALLNVADELVDQGCRVMLFDLFGRGYSSTPDPEVYPQNIGLFSTQVLSVLASSPISWTGTETFALIGYSLGGGIAASFASYFPTLVDSLILIAPAGLMRPSRIHWTSKLIYGGFFPSTLVQWLVWTRLGGYSSELQAETSGVEVTDAIEAETAPHPALVPDSQAPLSRRRPSVSVANVVSWQLKNHNGFLPAFISSIQHAPIIGQHDRWRLIGSRLAAQKLHPDDTEALSNGLREGKVLLLLGKSDSVVLAEEVSGDAKGVLGEGVDVRILEGGHEVPITHAEAVVSTIVQFWAGAVKT